MSGALHRPDGASHLPLVILIHGLTGCEGSAYVLAAARFLLQSGFPVMRLNLRGAGPSREECRGRYYAGGSDDLRQALERMPSEVGDREKVAVGFSLGGNVLLKYLGEEGASARLSAAAAVSVPIDLAACTNRFDSPRNRPYRRWMLSRLRAETLDGSVEVTPSERREARAASSIREFDDVYTGPRHGYLDAADFYDRCSAQRFMAEIRTPTLVIQARDDPWIPIEAYERFPWQRAGALKPVLVEHGGHIGFHGRDSSVPWHVRGIADYFRALFEWSAVTDAPSGGPSGRRT